MGGDCAFDRGLWRRHIGKYLPGNPTVVPKNMEGAASIRFANWLYNVAPKDGTAFGTIGRGTAIDPLLGQPAAQFHRTNFTCLRRAHYLAILSVARPPLRMTTF